MNKKFQVSFQCAYEFQPKKAFDQKLVLIKESLVEAQKAYQSWKIKNPMHLINFKNEVWSELPW